MSITRTAFRTAVILASAQALFMSSSIVTTTVASLAASGLLDNASLSTLPQALVPLIAMSVTAAAARAMRHRGRRAGFVVGACFGIASAVVCAIGLWAGSFLLFLVGVCLLGVYQGFATHYRFAAADDVALDRRARAVSLVLAGGVLAAVLGPTLAAMTADLVPAVPYLGSYVATLGLALFALLLLSQLPGGRPTAPTVTTGHSSLRTFLGRPRALVAVACCATGQAAMMLVMTATPLAMLGHGHSLGFASLVISWHVLAMFVPSFFSGALIERFGLARIVTAGLTLMVLSSIVALIGTERLHFALALIGNGLAWNFLFVSGSALLAGGDDPDERASLQGSNEFLTFAAQAVATFAAGALYALYGWGVLNAVGIGLILLAAAVIARHGRTVFTAYAVER